MRTSGEGAQLVYPTPSSRSCTAFRGNVAWFIGSASRATPPFCTASATRWMTSTSFGWSDVPPTPSPRHVRWPHRDDVDALGGGDGVDLRQRGQVLDHDGQRDLAVGLLEVLAHGDHPVVRGAARARHAAVTEGCIADGLDGLPRRARVADVRDLDALHAHVEEAQDEGGVGAGRADDGRDVHALGASP